MQVRFYHFPSLFCSPRCQVIIAQLSSRILHSMIVLVIYILVEVGTGSVIANYHSLIQMTCKLRITSSLSRLDATTRSNHIDSQDSFQIPPTLNSHEHPTGCLHDGGTITQTVSLFSSDSILRLESSAVATYAIRLERPKTRNAVVA